jgi:hypothetical protein
MIPNQESLTAESSRLLGVLAQQCSKPGDFVTFDAIFESLKANGGLDMDRFQAGLRGLLELELVVEYGNALGLSDAGLRLIEERRVGAKSCECGCGGESTSVFLSGHDQRLRIRLESEVGGILALRDLLKLVRQYRSGAIDESELGSGIRKAFWEVEND